MDRIPCVYDVDPRLFVVNQWGDLCIDGVG